MQHLNEADILPAYLNKLEADTSAANTSLGR